MYLLLLLRVHNSFGTFGVPPLLSDINPFCNGDNVEPLDSDGINFSGASG